jgi:hypothetical protein
MQESIMDFIQFYFNVVAGLILGFVGIIGNVLVIIIFLTGKLRKLPLSRYLVILAMTDIFALLSSIVMNITNVWKITILYCKLLIFFVTMFFQYCSNIIMIVSVDRLVSVKWFNKLKNINKLKFQLQIAFVALLLTLPISITGSMYYGSVDRVNGTSFCKSRDPKFSFYISIIIFSVSTLIPFFLLITCSFITWCVIKRLKIKLSTKETKKETQLFKTMIGMDLFFLICNTPVCTYTLIATILPSTYNLLLFNILNLLSTCHNTFSFFIYLSCNKIFREQFWTIIIKRELN